ncbi:MAG TPA: opioid growth factor receptor-related protein [Vicinamibacterales bacterium]|nr:opioid growth factor receptor-related protein [Vicinamibacterales bacterium]
MTTAQDAVVAFYSGGPDHRRRTLDQILSWTDEGLESVHDYVQWVFPTRQPSGVNPHAPLVTDATVRAFSDSADLRARLRQAFRRMLLFYGLRFDPDGAIGADPERFASRARVWLHPGNHNHLRLTRIMESLSTLGLRDDALALQRCLIEAVARDHGGVSHATLKFWARAIS